MENSQQINWLAILAPSLIVGLFAIIVQIFLTYWLSKVTENYKKDLSKEIEDYKKGISKELENHKFQLQSEFQTKFYEFQTRFSLLHQEQAKVIQKLFEMFVGIRTNLKIWELGYLADRDFLHGKYLETQEKYSELQDFYKKKCILLDENLCNRIESFSEKVPKILGLHYSSERLQNLETFEFRENATKLKDKIILIIEEEIDPILKILEREFRQLLSAENPNNQIEIKQ